MTGQGLKTLIEIVSTALGQLVTDGKITVMEKQDLLTTIVRSTLDKEALEL